MKSIVQNITNISLYLFSDETEVHINEMQTNIKDPFEFNIGDLNSSNCHLVENLTTPNGWVGHKYLVVNGAWAANPAWVEPITTSSETPSEGA